MAVVLCYGDSNTHGTLPMRHDGDKRRMGWQKRWPGVLSAALGPDHRVIEEGLPGRTICNDDPIEGPMWNGQRTLPSVLATHNFVDVLVITLGTNDLQSRFSMTGQELAWGVERLIKDALATGYVGLCLYVIPPRVREAAPFAEAFGGAVAREATFADHVHRLLEPYAARGVCVMDAGDVISVDPLDGIHFGEDAHSALGAAIGQKVQNMLKGPDQ